MREMEQALPILLIAFDEFLAGTKTTEFRRHRIRSPRASSMPAVEW
jgi:hypothetical protein